MDFTVGSHVASWHLTTSGQQLWVQLLQQQDFLLWFLFFSTQTREADLEGVGGEKHKGVKEAAMASEKKGNEGFFHLRTLLHQETHRRQQKRGG